MRPFQAAKLEKVRFTRPPLAMLVIGLILLAPAVAAGDRGSHGQGSKNKGTQGTTTVASAATPVTVAVTTLAPAPTSTSKESTTSSTPPSLVVVGTSTSTISLKWNPDASATSYIVTRDGNRIMSTHRTAVTIDSLRCSTSYRLKVDESRRSGYRITVGELTASTGGCAAAGAPNPTPTPTPSAPAADTQAPSVPAGLAKTATTTSVSVSWDASTDNVGVTGYGIYVNGVSVGSQAGRSFVLGSLACGTTRTFGVDAFDAAGNRSSSTEIAAPTAACAAAAPPPPAATPPPPPPSSSVTCNAVASPGSGTAQALLSGLSSGQTGCLHGGTYSPSGVYVLDFSKPGVTITSYPGERAVLRGLIVDRKGADKVHLTDVDIQGQAGVSNSIQVYAADFLLEGSDVTNNWQGRSCMILGDPSAGTAVRPVIRGNRFHECGNPANGNQDHGIYASSVSGGLITENVFWAMAAYAVQLYPNAQNTVFSHNVVDGGGSTRGGVIFGGSGSGSPSSGNTVEFNVITYSATYNVESWWGGSVGSGNVARSNCLYGGHNGDVSSPVGFTAASNASVDPRFANRGGHDYRLASGSPCLAVVGYDTAARIA